MALLHFINIFSLHFARNHNFRRHILPFALFLMSVWASSLSLWAMANVCPSNKHISCNERISIPFYSTIAEQIHWLCRERKKITEIALVDDDRQRSNVQRLRTMCGSDTIGTLHLRNTAADDENVIAFQCAATLNECIANISAFAPETLVTSEFGISNGF